jgi:hypothetical protein
VELGEAIRMCALYPACVIKKGGKKQCEHVTGCIVVGENYPILGLNEDLEIVFR